MPVRKSAKPVRRRVTKRVEHEETPEIQAQEIRHLHNVLDFKVALALAFVVVSSLVINVYAKGPNGSLSATTSTQDVLPVNTGRLIVSAKSDSTTASKIIVPSAAPIQLAKWSVVAENEPVKLERVRFSIVNADYSIRATASEFGKISLYGNDSVTLLAEAAPVVGANKGYVEFSGLNVLIQPGEPQTLSLRAVINGSGIMKQNSMIRFGINGSAAMQWKGTGVNTGTPVFRQSISYDPIVYSIGAPSPLNLFHNSAPVAFAGTLDSKLPLNSLSPVFKFTIQNPGDRELRIGKLLVNVMAYGLNNVGSPTTTGFVNGFKLFEANSSGGLGQPIATAGNCLTSPTVTGPKLGTAVIPGTGTCSLSSVFLTFDRNNDVNSLMDNLTIPAGNSRTFVVTADTSNILNGKVSGSVSLNAQLSGNTGTFPSTDPKKPSWGGGGIFYYYTPVAGKENAQPYNHSDSYSVIGPTLTNTL